MSKEMGVLSQEEYKNKFRINNAVAFANPANYGLEKTLTTLTQVVKDVLRQKFYTVDGALTDYVPMELGTGAYGQNLFQYTVAQVGDQFETGIVQPGNGINKDANVDIVIDGVTIRNNYWRMKYQATKELIEMAKANAVNFSYIEEQETARLKTYQLGVQKVTFLGTNDGLNTGLLNNGDVTINTSLLPANIGSLSVAQLFNFATTAVSTFWANSNNTVFPNTLLIPTQQLGGLAVPVSQTYPFGQTKRELIERAFKEAGAPQDFKILHTAYNNTAGTGGTQRYVLYKRDPEVLKMYLPKPYTPYPLFPTGSLDLVSDAEAQFTGVWVKRPKEVLYIDVTA